MESVLVLVQTESDGLLGKASLDVLAGASALGGQVVAGVFGESVGKAAEQAASYVGKVLTVEDAVLGTVRSSTDALACEALVKAAAPTVVLAPSTSRMARCLPTVAVRTGGRIDTRIAEIEGGENLSVSRWFYRQRMQGTFTRAHRPWFLIVEAGSLPLGTPSGVGGAIESVAVAFPSEPKSMVVGTEPAMAGEQTIRPDAELLFVAGAGWTKKQADGQTHVPEAESLIRQFLQASQASLGSSKSLVDQSGEGAVISFLTHMNQVGQTGASPRHAKGLATCCHGEEPHVVGWRFVGERRAVNTNANCGWAQGKADVVYVADAFQVVQRLNEILSH